MLQKHRKQSTKTVHCGVLTISDTRTSETDKSGQLIKELLADDHHSVLHYEVIQDEKGKIQTAVQELIEREDMDAILLNGGTGVAKRDVTIEAIQPYLDKELPGFGELFRYLSYELDIGSASILSRAIAGVSKNKAIFAMPGSSGAVKLAMEKIILNEIGHIVSEIQKDL